MTAKNTLVFTFVLSLTVLALLFSLFQISKSRTFQFFGGLVHRVNTDQKIVALTFDDAPTEFSEDVLSLLQEKNVKATFYAIGQNLEKNPELGRHIVQNGHEMGNHSYSHQRFLLKSPAFIDDEIQKTNQLIRQTGYSGEITFRPPNGKKLFFLPWYLHQHNIKTIMWDVEPDTALVSTGDEHTDRDFIVKNALQETKPGSIILLHPFCESCGADRAAIGPIIDDLRRNGYTFVTVSELLLLQN